ncbi:hypothetical protein GCM10008932_08850 [Alkalibacterium iburiense]|uniref:Uncharacterized protein n=1 Tax=Alkalibacterium iburiense TaxID=290589 RepID=A0ABN0X939_9LACT
MKKGWIVLCVSILCLLLFPGQVFSQRDTEEIDPGVRVEGMETDDGTMWWRYAYWDTTAGFPDYVGYVEYTEEAHFEVGLTENTEENRTTILEKVPYSAEEIVFMDATYSREEQKAFQNQLSQSYMTGENLEYDIWGVSWDKEAVALFAEEEHLEEYREYFEREYGERLVVHPQSEFKLDPVDWVGYYLSLLPPEPDYGTEEYVTHHFGEDDGTIDWRYQYWAITENWPDNISFVRLHSDQTTWEIGLVENTHEARQDILDLVPHSAEQIDFLDAKYSLNELNQVQEEITEEFFMAGDHPVYSSGIQSDRIIVTVGEEHLEEYTDLFNERYGDRVQVEVGVQAETTEEALFENTATDTHTSWVVGLVLLGMGAVTALFIWQKNQTVKKKQTNTGHTWDDRHPLSNIEVRNLIQDTQYEPNEKVYRTIKERTLKK